MAATLKSAKDQTVLTLADASEWAQWLLREADNSNGVWLTLAKKGVTEPTSLTYDRALNEALCFGWIDGQRRKGDSTTFVQRYTPRRPRSIWSQRNVGLITRLESEGRMRPRGRLEVEKAKADGRWAAAYSQATLEPPRDLLAAIAANHEAQTQWNALSKQNKFAICFRLASMKTEAGRQKRIEAYVTMLARGESLYPQKQARELSKTAVPKPRIAQSSANGTNPSLRRSQRLSGLTGQD